MNRTATSMRADLRHLAADRRTPVLAVAVLIGASAVRVPAQPLHTDPAVYLEVVHRMRDGQAYFPAMDTALRDAGIGPVGTARGMRTPWLFDLWAALPNERAIWMTYLLGIAVTAWAADRIVRNRWAILAPTLALLWIADIGSMLVEPWAVPWMMASIAFSVQDRNKSGAACAAMAIIVRELALPVAIGGLLYAMARDRARWPWLAALGVAFGSFWLHARMAAPYLVQPGVEAKLWMSAKWLSLPHMAGFGLPLDIVIGPIVWVIAVIAARRRGWLLLLGPLLSFLAISLVADRFYWGAILVPFTTMLAADFAIDRWHERQAGVEQSGLTLLR